MKKLLCAVLILCLVPMISLAEIDLSGLSTEELMDLNKAVIMEIFSRDDFQLVTVPAGTYKVGEDIPAGPIPCRRTISPQFPLWTKRGTTPLKSTRSQKRIRWASWFWKTAKACRSSTASAFPPMLG